MHGIAMVNKRPRPENALPWPGSGAIQPLPSGSLSRPGCPAQRMPYLGLGRGPATAATEGPRRRRAARPHDAKPCAPNHAGPRPGGGGLCRARCLAKARSRAALLRAWPAAERMSNRLAPLMCMCRKDGSCDWQSLGRSYMASWKLVRQAHVPWRLTVQPALRKGGSSMKQQHEAA